MVNTGTGTTARRPVALLLWVTLTLAVGAASLAPWLLLASRVEDVEALESPLVLATARQLVHSPRELYGPYDGGNRLVLIHAPLYYRIAGLMAWPIYRAGVDPVLASLFAGRMLSLAGLLGTLVAAFWLARLGDAPPVAGWWAALLAAATPVYGGLPFEVRPDLASVALLTMGVLLLLKERGSEPPRARMLLAAFVCFALAVCIKQQFIAVPAVSTWLLLGEWRRGRVCLRTLASVLLAAIAIAATYYGIEEWATRGFLSRSVFVAAALVNRVHPAGWMAAFNILMALVWKCVGPILLLATAGLVTASTKPGSGRKGVLGMGAMLVGTIAVLAVIQLFVLHMWLSVSIVAGLIVILAWVIPTSLLAHGRSATGGAVDRALWAYLAAELVLVAILCKLSTGAWYNYAIEAVVLACVLAARALASGLKRAPAAGPLLATALAALAVPAFAWTDVQQVITRRRSESAWTDQLIVQLRRPPQELFFVDRPGDNRVHGRPDLVYDPWLYAVFEQTGQAEPRQEWLARELTRGAVRVVVATSPQFRIEGITPSLPEMGYRRLTRFGPYFIWVRGY